MKKFHTFVSPVFSVSLVVFLACVAIAGIFGGIGPCGPANVWGLVCFFGLPLGLIGMAIGLLLSVIKTIIYFQSSARKKPDEQI